MPKKLKSDNRAEENEARKDELGTTRARSVRRVPAKVAGCSACQPVRTQITRALRSCRKRARQLRQQGWKAQKMLRTIRSGRCIRTMNTDVRMICRRQEVQTVRKRRSKISLSLIER